MEFIIIIFFSFKVHVKMSFLIRLIQIPEDITPLHPVHCNLCCSLIQEHLAFCHLNPEVKVVHSCSCYFSCWWSLQQVAIDGTGWCCDEVLPDSVECMDALILGCESADLHIGCVKSSGSFSDQLICFGLGDGEFISAKEERTHAVGTPETVHNVK